MKTLALWMKKVADICAEATKDQPDSISAEATLEPYSAELLTIKKEVQDLALKFPVPGI